MKSILIWITMGNLFAALAAAPPARYRVIDLDTLKNGPFSIAISVSRDEIVKNLQSSGLPDGSQHAILWYRGSIIDLATTGFGGSNSGAFGVNALGMASGLAETSKPDPGGEDFCGFGTFHTCLPFLWYAGVMFPLPDLGVIIGEAGLINNRSEVAGNTENAIPDGDVPVRRVATAPGEASHLAENGKVNQLPTFPANRTDGPSA